MGGDGADGGLNVDNVVLFLDQWPKFQCLVLTCRNNELFINQNTDARNILRVTIIVGNQSAFSQGIDFVHFNDLVLTCSQHIRMEILNT